MITPTSNQWISLQVHPRKIKTTNQLQSIFMGAKKNWKETIKDSGALEIYTFSKNNITHDSKILEVVISIARCYVLSESTNIQIDLLLKSEKDCADLVEFGKSASPKKMPEVTNSFSLLKENSSDKKNLGVRYEELVGANEDMKGVLRTLDKLKEFDSHMEEIILLLDGVPAEINRSP